MATSNAPEHRRWTAAILGGVTQPLGAVAAAAPAAEGARRSEILEIAAGLFADSGYVRTSLKDVADACGILPGSLYHHFDSKQAIAIELLERYHAELAQLGRSWLAEPAAREAQPTCDLVVAFGTAVAECGIRHGAALQLSAYEPHAGATPMLVELARRKAVVVTAAMRQILDDGAARGDLNPAVNPAMLAVQLCETMLHIGLARLYKDALPAQTAALLGSMLLYGIAVEPPADQLLDNSAAMAGAIESIADWSAPGQDDPDDRRAALRAVARAEFARRGYEATTIRDIAAAAGLGIGSVYRLIDSKEALLASIMNSYYSKLSAGYQAISGSGSTAIEKLDALSWLNINALDRFGAEFEIQRAWFRSFPPAANSLTDALKDRTLQIQNIVAQGLRDGEFRFHEVALQSLTPCVRDLIWIRPDVIELTDNRGALAHSRAALLRGAATASGRAAASARTLRGLGA